MILIELVYQEGCLHAPLARAHLARACLAAGVSQRWTEWNLSAGAPGRVCGLRSPTILINGRDPSLPAHPDATLLGVIVPPVKMIAAALAAAKAVSPDIPEKPCRTSVKRRSRRSRRRR